MLNKAESIADVDKAMRNVTWNENVIAADENGDIGYWHPGLHQLKPKRWDERLPMPGTGEAEWRGLLPRGRTPHVINPDQGWLANWNNPPSFGWTNGDGEARERLTGKYHRVRIIQREVARVARNPSFEKSTAIVETTGTTAQQFPFFAPKLDGALESADEQGSALIEELQKWDGNYDREGADGTVDPGVAIWEEYKDQVEAILLRPMGEGAEILAGEHRRIARVRHHQRRGRSPPPARPEAVRKRRERRGRRPRGAIRLRRPGDLARAAADVRGRSDGRGVLAGHRVLRPRHVEPVGDDRLGLRRIGCPAMKLYICWGTFQTIRPGGHPCANAYNALKEAGHDPEVIKVRGLGIGPVKFDTDGRREVEEISGQKVVPVLVTDDDEVITDSKRIVEWAQAHPASVDAPAAG